MARFLKSKFFIIIAFVAIFIALAVTAASAMGYSSAIKDGINTVLTPLQKGFDYIGRSLDGYAEYITEFDRIKKENTELKNRLAELSGEIYDARALENENEFLKKYLELKDSHLDFTFQDANVIGRESSGFSSVFSLNKGTDSGIDVNEPVVDEHGALVGVVTESGSNWSKVFSILNSSTSIGVYNERSNAPGIVSGDYDLSKKGLCKMEYISADADIQPGDRIVTSGKGSIYPAGLTVGIVEEVLEDDNMRTKYAIIRPSAQMDMPDHVMVVTEFQKTVE